MLFNPRIYYMKPRHNNFKTLYTNCSKQGADKDQLNALLQEQLAYERKQYTIMAEALWASQQREMQQIDTNTDLQQENTQLKVHNTLQAETILAQAEQNHSQENLITDLNLTVGNQRKQLDKNDDLQSRLDEVRHELRMLKRYQMGTKSEKHHRLTEDQNGEPVKDPQLLLDFEVDAWGVCQLNKHQKISFVRGGKITTPGKPGGRRDIPGHLPEEITVIEPDNIPRNAKCIGHIDQILIACDPLRWYKKITRRMVYLTVAEDEITHKQLIAPLPPHPIPHCKMDISVLVMMTIDKYLYHLPIWRQRRRFLQYGMELAYSTMAHDVGKISDVLEPLAHLLLKEIMISRHMHLDETGYLVLDNTKKKGKKSHRGWMWAAMNPVQRICCFMYQKGRGKKDIGHVLKGYKGHLHTDAHKAYIKYGQQRGVEHAKCAGHIRRYFDQALENDHARACYALEQFFGPLYGIEEECKLLALDYDQITEKRQAQSVPVLYALRGWLIQELPKLTRRTPIYKAVAYALNNFDGMMIYTSDGMLEIDNNSLEREIRSIALGRRNHLFAGSHRGAERAAVIYSLIATCKLQGIDPSKWMSDVLRRIKTQPPDKLHELLPQFWKPTLIQATVAAS